ncbi:hypothetical protein YC2023_081129 [Brassica napus]
MAAQHRSTEHQKYRSLLNFVDRYSHQWQLYSQSLHNCLSWGLVYMGLDSLNKSGRYRDSNQLPIVAYDFRIISFKLNTEKDRDFFLSFTDTELKQNKERDCPSVLLEDKQKGKSGGVDRPRILPTFSHSSFELPFECRLYEVNQHHVADVMPVLLKSGQNASRNEAVEEMKDCRSTLQH